MAVNLLLVAIIIIVCVLGNKISNRLGMPVLLIFILLGMFFGSDGIVKIKFDDYFFAEQVCSIALLFIMFYGGFGTKWNEAKPVAAKAILLSSLGTVLTAGFVGAFCFLIMGFPVLESFLVGSVVSSTDAASVFSILRSKKLNLRDHTASLLEIESGSNDPFAYMLTIIVLSLMNGTSSPQQFVYLIFSQIVYGGVFGLVIAMLTLLLFKKFRLSSSGFYSIFVLAIAIISYAIPTLFNGNGYLGAYITGIILGNSKISNKPELVHFFDGITGLMQILLFFLLGLLSFPSQLPKVAFPALAISIFLTFVARPAAVYSILTPFKSTEGQKRLVSWAGLRGAASIVFAIMAVINSAIINNDIFHIVFFIVLFSILIQGTLIPFVAKKLNMTDNSIDVMSTFNDYMDELPVQFLQLSIPSDYPWVHQKVKEILLPPDSFLLLIVREKENIIPNGETEIFPHDVLILSGKSPQKIEGLTLFEMNIKNKTHWHGKRIADVIGGNERIVVIKRGESIVIPVGDTVLLEEDVLVFSEAL
ncbi:K(+)/H(+) antiporter NhaP [Anaerotignum neopropionicum]|uniref:K(+)/H(+) antiporter NhaP n=1 Tax=Anaerotignum neopropionicum TaxID=36847 RepID=A0A136WEC3_9FIRM|nr:potassium/proton antiporter [Anaerotignum neopropionicum]KXL52699.1 K(+)/H(+) antiporter NhaP [Anaerotignum neopropionicum]